MEERKYAVKLGTDGSIEIVEKPDEERFLDFCYREIGCDLIECAHTDEKLSLALIVDEEGLLQSEPLLNPVASYLYGTHKHLQPIAGNALIMNQTFDDFVLLTIEEARKMEQKLRDIAVIAYRVVTAALNRRHMISE